MFEWTNHFDGEKMKKLFVCLFVFGLVFCGSASAADSPMVGLSSYFCNYDISDPDGDTDDYSGFQHINVIYIAPLSNKNRLFIEGGMVDFKTSASTKQIGNTVSGYRLSAAYQWKIRPSRKLHFWLGGGVSLFQLDYESRYTVTRLGYLQTLYQDRSESSFSGYINASKEWEVFENFDFGVNLAYQLSFDNSISGFSAGAAVYYRFGGH